MKMNLSGRLLLWSAKWIGCTFICLILALLIIFGLIVFANMFDLTMIGL